MKNLIAARFASLAARQEKPLHLTLVSMQPSGTSNRSTYGNGNTHANGTCYVNPFHIHCRKGAVYFCTGANVTGNCTYDAPALSFGPDVWTCCRIWG